MSRLSIHPMTRAELDIGIGWAADEGWNPGLHDGDSFHATDPGGFLLGRLDGEPIGMVSAVKYGSGFGFIGFYIVRPAWRGQGHGLALWQAAMARLQGRLVGLDGVVAQQDNYRRSGFQLAYNNVRHEGVPQRATRPDTDVRPLAQVRFDELLRYDTAFFPEPREVFLRHWIAQRGSVALGIQRNGELAGYGVLRPCREAFKIGPLFADDAELADRLLRALVATLPAGARVQLDIPAVNPAAVALVAMHGLAPVFQTARMYTAAAPRLALERLYGVTTFELG
jgi:GNAT superfamily N-acetyltransferase